MFGRKKKTHDEPAEAVDDVVADDPSLDADGAAEPDGTADPESGPWSLDDLDGERDAHLKGRLDLGSILLALPPGGQLQVEMNPAGAAQAVHIVTPHGRITVAAFAAPKSPGQWREVAGELSDTLRRDNASVSVESGPWGREVVGSTANADLRFIGVDGYRWMIRGVATGPAGAVAQGSALVQQARAVVAGTIVDRGTDPHPVRTPLPITLPKQLVLQLEAAQKQQAAQQVAQQTAGQQGATQQGVAQQGSGVSAGPPATGAGAPTADTPATSSPTSGGPDGTAPDGAGSASDGEQPRRRGPSGSAMQQLR